MFGRDQEAASPLVVLGTFVAVAILVTSLGVFFLVNGSQKTLELVAVDDGPSAGLRVDSVSGGLRWDDLDIVLLDPAGVDVSGDYLEIPRGLIDAGETMVWTSQPPAGDYLLDVAIDGKKLATLSLTF